MFLVLVFLSYFCFSPFHLFSRGYNLTSIFLSFLSILTSVVRHDFTMCVYFSLPRQLNKKRNPICGLITRTLFVVNISQPFSLQKHMLIHHFVALIIAPFAYILTCVGAVACNPEGGVGRGSGSGHPPELFWRWVFSQKNGIQTQL